MNVKTLLVAIILLAFISIGCISNSNQMINKTTTSIKWLGHSSFEITTFDGNVILIDPWIKENPINPMNLSDINKTNIILITHDHFDHVGDSVEIANRTGAVVVTSPELADRLINENNLTADKLVNGIGMNIGGSVRIYNTTITMTQAVHSVEIGSPAGYIIRTVDGTTIYHAGDTGIFQGMESLGDLYKIDVALLPIGDVFTMGPTQAAYSLKLLKPKAVIPMHYATFPMLVQNADEFVTDSYKSAPFVKVIPLSPGETYQYVKRE
jgi:L-ascorbate metabolism protein UlaG (beta-lactamase superfamily)